MMPDTHILNTISPEVRTVVWVSQENLGSNTPFYPTIDYLLDGLVRSHLEDNKELSQVTFVHQVFGKSLWVIFANSNNCELNSLMSAIKNIIPEESRSKMVILNSQALPTAWADSLDRIFTFVEKI